MSNKRKHKGTRPETPKKKDEKKKRESTTISLHPLSFEEALEGLLKAKPPKEDDPPKDDEPKET